MNKGTTAQKGFTLIELLIVIAIIGILASVVLTTVNTARDKAMTAKVMSELRNTRSAITLLEDDTGKWPNGCEVATVLVGNSNEVELDTAAAGIVSTPAVGVTDPSTNPPCEWTATDVNNWKGPYMPTALDPWGMPYWYDSDYYPKRDCPYEPGICPTAGNGNLNCGIAPIAALVSGGPNKANGAQNANYDCDDIYMQIQ